MADSDDLMEDGARVPLPVQMPKFRPYLMTALLLVLVSGGIAMFWPKPAPVRLHLCGTGLATESCIRK